MTDPAAVPQELFKVGETGFRVVWRDGRRSDYGARDLRLACPCAQCRDEWSGRLLLDPATVPEELAISDAALVGNYAVQFRFSDGHGSGIYSFEKLRELSDGAAEGGA